MSEPASGHQRIHRGAHGEDAAERRPTILILVYTWDIILAILAAFATLAAFSGTRLVNGRTESIAVPVQFLQALAYAALGTGLFLIGTFLTRRAAWVRRAQIVVLAMHAALAALSVTYLWVVDASQRDLTTLLATVALILIDGLAVLAVMSNVVRRRFNEAGQIPVYLGAIIAFWAAASCAFFILGLTSA